MFIIEESIIPNSGRGVFTTKAYKKGDYICFYDGEDVFGEVKHDNTYAISHPTGGGYRDGFRNIINPEGVGQLINDSSCILLDDSHRDSDYGLFTIEGTNTIFEAYKKSVSDNSNVVMKEEFRMYALRDIDVGEELYYAYGPDYWITRIGLVTDEPLTRLFCWLATDILKRVEENYTMNDDIWTSDMILSALRINPKGCIMKAFDLQNVDSEHQLDHLIQLIV